MGVAGILSVSVTARADAEPPRLHLLWEREKHLLESPPDEEPNL